MAFAVAAIVIPPAPIGIIRASDNGNEVETDSATDAMPSTMAPPAIRTGCGRPPMIRAIAAPSAPRPEAVIRNPYPAASLPRTFAASGGMRTVKFMPTVATSPTTVTASSTTGVSRT